jgi:hypothetical protein
MKKFLASLITVFVLCQVLLPALAFAHGSVVADGDLCVINIGFYRAHFKVFQPQTSEQEEFCEDLPETGESIFVMEYLHKDLGTVPIEFRILRDVTGLGRFARLSDVEAIENLDEATVFHQAATVEPGVFTVLYQFSGEGDYLGYVTARHPDTDQTYSAVFPFHVGSTDWGYLPLFALLVIMAQLGYLMAVKGWRPPFMRKTMTTEPSFSRILMLLPLLFLMGAADMPQPMQWQSEHGLYRVSYTSEENPVPLNRIHSWILHLETAEGAPVDDALLTLNGGMPAHNHGLATAPVVSGSIGNGDYRVEGLRFHMQGAWEMRLEIRVGETTDNVVIPLSI